MDVLVRALNDGDISVVESAELRRIAHLHGLSDQDIRRASIRAATIYANFFLQDGFLDPQEEVRLQLVFSKLGVTLADVDQSIAHAIQLGKHVQLIAAGQLPVIHPSQLPVAVSPAETVHAIAYCSIFEDRVVARQTVGGSVGMRFRVAKGVSVGVGGFRGVSVPITQNQCVSNGPLLLTSFGARYMGSAKGFQKSWSKIAGVNPCADGIVFFFSDRVNPAVLRYADRRVAPIVEAVTIAMLK